MTQAGVDVQSRFDNSLSGARSLTNIEIQFVDTLWRVSEPENNGKEFFRTVLHSYIASGTKYRTSSKLLSGSETNMLKLSVSAFDGETFSSYSGDYRYLTRGRVVPTGSVDSPNNPLVAPFVFLSKRSDDCPPCILRFSDLLSDRLASKFVLPQEQSSDGKLSISIPGLPLRAKPIMWRVLMDESGNSFNPVEIIWTVPGASIRITTTLLNYTNLGFYQFPTQIEWTMSKYPSTTPPTLISTGLVKVLSAQVPAPIPDTLFRLDDEEKSAVMVWNADLRKLIKSDPAFIKIETVKKTTRGAITILVFTSIILPISLLIIKKLRSTKAS